MVEIRALVVITKLRISSREPAGLSGRVCFEGMQARKRLKPPVRTPLKEASKVFFFFSLQTGAILLAPGMALFTPQASETVSESVAITLSHLRRQPQETDTIPKGLFQLLQ